MNSYLPRFTLRRGLILIGILALFLGWLRPDRANLSDRSRMHPAQEFWYIEFRPHFYPTSISIHRVNEFDGVRWMLSVKTTSTTGNRQSVTAY